MTTKKLEKKNIAFTNQDKNASVTILFGLTEFIFDIFRLVYFFFYIMIIMNFFFFLDDLITQINRIKFLTTLLNTHSFFVFKQSQSNTVTSINKHVYLLLISLLANIDVVLNFVDLFQRLKIFIHVLKSFLFLLIWISFSLNLLANNYLIGAPVAP